MAEAEVTSAGTCATCQAPASLKCSGCSSVFYCGKEHQKQDWVQHKTQCRAFEISTSTELGRHLVARRDIKKGEVILTENPFVLAPQRVVEYPTCIGCCVKLSPTSKTVCPGCKWPACDKKCPKLKDPAFHGGRECAVFSLQASTKRYDWHIVLPFRVFDIHFQKRNPKMSKWIKERGPFAVARQVQGYTHFCNENVEDSRRSLLWMKTFLAASISSCIIPTSKEFFAVSEYCALNLPSARNGSLRGLYPNSSLMQHSCAPNTRLLFDKPGSISSVAERKDSYQVGRITVKAVRNIRKGEKLSWTCTRQSDTTIMRQSYLAATRNMNCLCERCKDPTEFGTHWDTWKCHLCSGWVNLATSLLPEVTFKCNKCGLISDRPANGDIAVPFLCKVKNVLSKNNKEHITGQITKLEELLKTAENHVHRGNSIMFCLKTELLLGYGMIAYFNGVEALDEVRLQKTQEFGREVLGNMEKLGDCFFRDEAGMSDCLFILTEAEVEIMKRNYKSGKWSWDETKIALEKCRNNLGRARELESLVPELRHHRMELISMKMTELHNWEKNLSEKNQECEQRCASCKKPAFLKCTACHLVYYCDKTHQKEDWSKHKAWCLGFEVRTTVELGPHLIATRDYKRDDVLLTETPFLVGPPLFGNILDICVGCCRSLDPVTKAVCPRCKWPICNSRCPGLKSSKKHAAECGILSGCSKLNWPPGIAHMEMNRCLLALRCLLLRKINPGKWKWMEKMVPFSESKIVNPMIRYSLAMSFASFPYLRDQPMALVLEVLAVVDVYGLYWRCNKTRIVSALSTNAGLLQQSCCPNTRVSYEDPPTNSANSAKSGVMAGRVTVKALKDISKGEVLTCMWADQLSMNLRRQSELRNMKNIKCSCPRCLDPRELGTDFSTLKCTLCSGWVVAIQPCSELVDWKCLSCGVIMSEKEVEDRLNYLNKEIEELVNLDRARQAVDISQVTLLQSLLNTYLHPNHELCFTLKVVTMKHIGNSPGLAGIPKLSDGDLETKAELCRQLIESTEKLGISFSNSEELFASFLAQLATSRAERLKRKFARREVTKEEAVKCAVECRALLGRAMKLITLPNVLDIDTFKDVAATEQYMSVDVAILTWANANGLNLAVE